VTITSGVPGARKKLERALFHAGELRTAVDAFREQSPYEFEMKSLGNPQGGSDIRINVKVSQAPPVPDSWGLITGDVLTNVRAALDHAIYPHVRRTAPTFSPRRIQYPIFDSADDFAAKTVRWFSPEVRGVVEESQPYHFDDPGEHPLRMLRELVNIDKHRELLVATYSVGDLEVELDDLCELVSPPKVYEVPMVVGALVARAHLRLVRPVKGGWWMQRPCAVVYRETLEIPGIEGPSGLLQAVEWITAGMGTHLDALEAAGC
jgi:hypothetical protein